MAKQIHLSIPEPCHENWNNMTPTDKGRFCDSCQKQVIDFSGMTDREIAQFFKKPSTGSLCGRFMQNQLNRDIDIPRKRIPWIKYFFQLVLPAFLFSSRGKAQGSIITIDTVVAPEKSKRVQYNVEQVEKEDTTAKKISGRIVDEKGGVIPHASILIKGTNQGTISDADGFFNLKIYTKEKAVILNSSCVGFESQELKVNVEKPLSNVTISLNFRVYGYMEGIIITTRKNKSAKSNKKSTIPLIPGMINDSLTGSLKVYPNPAHAGETLTIETDSKNNNSIKVSVMDASGGQLLLQNRQILKGTNKITINIDSRWVTGLYFINISDEKGKIIGRAKFQVQPR